MAMALVDDGLATVDAAGQRVPVADDRGARAQAHRAAHHRGGRLREEHDHRVRRLLVELGGVGVLPAELVARKLDDRALQADADAEKGLLGFPAVGFARDLPLDATASEAAGHENTLRRPDLLPSVLVGLLIGLLRPGLQLAGVHPRHHQAEARFNGGVLQGLHHADVRVWIARVLADQRYRNLLRALLDAVRHHLPVTQPLGCRRRGERGRIERQRRRHGAGCLPRGGPQAQLLADQPPHGLLRQQQGYLVQVGHVVQGDDHLWRHLAEQRQLLARRLVDLDVAAAHQQVRLQARLAQQLHRVLAGLGLLLVGGADCGDHAQMDHQEVLVTHPEFELLQCLQVDGALDVPHGAAQLHQADLRRRAGAVDVLAGHVGDPVLDRVRDVRYHLNRLAEVVASALALDDLVVHLAGGHAVSRREGEAQEALVVPEVEVRLAAVFEHVHLAVLEGAHGAGVDIQVRVNLDRGDPEPVGLQHHADRRDRGALAQAGDGASSDDHVLHVWIPVGEAAERA
mmetsp:Transcript_127504/g.342209  ORF Transcript_127504/g.342209 Transcript_127504/m.342209 type:complete len:514 (-) Transcript_127504:151-1692(-)